MVSSCLHCCLLKSLKKQEQEEKGKTDGKKKLHKDIFDNSCCVLFEELRALHVDAAVGDLVPHELSQTLEQGRRRKEKVKKTEKAHAGSACVLFGHCCYVHSCFLLLLILFVLLFSLSSLVFLLIHVFTSGWKRWPQGSW